MFQLWNPRFSSEKLGDYFQNITSKIVEHRENYGIEKLDLVSLLMGVRRREMNKISMDIILERESSDKISVQEVKKAYSEAGIDSSDQTIAAQAMTFFYFGYDIVPTVLCFLFYELALNPSIQMRLIEELDHARANCGSGKLSVEELLELPYLKMVTQGRKIYFFST